MSWVPYKCERIGSPRMFELKFDEYLRLLKGTILFSYFIYSIIYLFKNTVYWKYNPISSTYSINKIIHVQYPLINHHYGTQVTFVFPFFFAETNSITNLFTCPRGPIHLFCGGTHFTLVLWDPTRLFPIYNGLKEEPVCVTLRKLNSATVLPVNQWCFTFHESAGESIYVNCEIRKKCFMFTLHTFSNIFIQRNRELFFLQH